jgi:hypothetical protein
MSRLLAALTVLFREGDGWLDTLDAEGSGDTYRAEAGDPSREAD